MVRRQELKWEERGGERGGQKHTLTWRIMLVVASTKEWSNSVSASSITRWVKSDSRICSAEENRTNNVTGAYTEGKAPYAWK